MAAFWDHKNQLAEIETNGKGTDEAHRGRRKLIYDGSRRWRIQKNYDWLSGWSWSSVRTTYYLYDGRLLVQERSSPTYPTATYVWCPDLSGTIGGAGGIGGLLARSTGYNRSTGTWNTHRYYHCDGMGNGDAMIDSEGNVTVVYQYDPYRRRTRMKEHFSRKLKNHNYGILSDSKILRREIGMIILIRDMVERGSFKIRNIDILLALPWWFIGVVALIGTAYFAKNTKKMEGEEQGGDISWLPIVFQTRYWRELKPEEGPQWIGWGIHSIATSWWVLLAMEVIAGLGSVIAKSDTLATFFWLLEESEVIATLIGAVLIFVVHISKTFVKTKIG